MRRPSFLELFRRPSRPASPEEADRLSIEYLQKAGADLVLPRHVLHFIYFTDETDARNAADELEESGYTVTVTPPTEHVEQWVARSEANRVVDARTVVTTRAWFERVAADHRGEYDGWEAANKP